MADTKQAETRPDLPDAQWSRRRALAIVTAAWAALGLIAILVFLGCFALTALLVGTPTLDGGGMLATIVFLCLIILTWGVMYWASARSTRDAGDGVDYGEIQVRPALPILSVMVLTAAGSAALAVALGINPRLILANLFPMVFSGVAIDVRLGPKIRRHCPELWEAAVRHWEKRDRHIAIMGQAAAALIVAVPVFLIVVIAVTAIFGD